MAQSPILRISRRNWTSPPSDSVLSFLNPTLQSSKRTPQTSVSHFSTTAQLCRPRRDYSKNRGVSALRRTGPRKRQTLSVSVNDLPKPVTDPADKPKIEGDENHGLWAFFNKNRRLIATPAEDMAHGRAWTVQELRQKSWDDLHTLWWVCVKERNRLATEKRERKRTNAGYGDFEAEDRDGTVKLTMRAIMHTLTERWYAWEEARKVAKTDEEVDLSGEGPAYKPGVTGDAEFEDELIEEDTKEKYIEDGKDEPAWLQKEANKLEGSVELPRGNKDLQGGSKEEANVRSPAVQEPQRKDMPDDFFNRRSV